MTVLSRVLVVVIPHILGLAYGRQSFRSPSRTAILADDTRMRKRRAETPACRDLCQGCIEIPIFFHILGFPIVDGSGQQVSVIPFPPQAVLGILNQTQGLSTDLFMSMDSLLVSLEAQMAVINLAFHDTPFRFLHANKKSPTIANKPQWTQYLLDHTREVKDAVGTDDPKVLDVFVAYELASSEDFSEEDEAWTLAGYGTFPGYQDQLFLSDSIGIRFDSLPALPGGGQPGYGKSYEVYVG